MPQATASCPAAIYDDFGGGPGAAWAGASCTLFPRVGLMRPAGPPS